jgi:uncharacterized protein YbaP (TraB family)
VKSTIANCKQYAGETDLDGLVDVQHSALKMNVNTLLSSYYTSAQFRKIDSIYQQHFGYSLTQVPSMSPIMVVNMFLSTVIQQDRNFSLDEELWNHAKSLNINIIGLESTTEQLAIYDKISSDYHAKQLYSIACNFGKFRKSVNLKTDDYSTTDLQKMYRSAKKGSGENRRLLIYDRNEILAQRVNELSLEQSTFSTFGAGHLWGKFGILRKLKLLGWKVKGVC